MDVVFFFFYLFLGHGQGEGHWEGERAEDEEVKGEKEGGKVDAICLKAAGAIFRKSFSCNLSVSFASVCMSD